MPSKGQRIGYVRVSSYDQNEDRQLEHMGELDRVFIDKASGKNTERPRLQELLHYAREGDTIVVHSMDRLARNLDDLRQLVNAQTRRGICVQFIKENLIFTGEDAPMSNLMLSVLGAVVQFERDLINLSAISSRNVRGRELSWQRSGGSIRAARNPYRLRKSRNYASERMIKRRKKKSSTWLKNTASAARRCTSISNQEMEAEL
jgi:DNA invertase Pin-like site-specific DNA recombinase